MTTGKAASLLIDTKATLEGVKGTLSKVRSGAAEARATAKELRKELDEARKEPFIDAGVGVVIAVGGGAAAGAVDLAVGPLMNVGGTETKDAAGKTTYKGGINLMPSAIIGAGMTVLGAQEESKSMLDLGKSMLAGYSYGQSQNLLSGMWTK
ncbi:MAG: hypothetical protein EPO08_20635 [Rhodospirillaceae bacterium]|nr:MAG: hypothetical protein EPO08_20635 [Rhodospirillaceae bacterium]